MTVINLVKFLKKYAKKDKNNNFAVKHRAPLYLR